MTNSDEPGFDVLAADATPLDMRSLQYVDPLDHLTCPICQLPFIIPFQTKCGHIFCKACLLETFRSPIGHKCPLDRQPLYFRDDEADADDSRENDIFPAPIIISNITDDMRVRCANQARGCEWVGPRWSIKTHLLLDCEYTRFECGSTCKKLTQRRFLDDSGECPHTEYACEFCEATISKPEAERHLTRECEKNLKKCKGCQLSFPHKSIESHEKFCDKFVDRCPAAAVGCDWKGSREMCRLHQETCVFTKLQPILDAKDKQIQSLKESTSFLSSKLEIILDSIIQGKVTNAGFPLQLEEVGAQHKIADSDYVHLVMELERLRTDFLRIQPSVAAFEAQQQMINGLVAQNTHLMEDLTNQRLGLNSVRQQIQFLLMDRRPASRPSPFLRPPTAPHSDESDDDSAVGRSNKL